MTLYINHAAPYDEISLNAFPGQIRLSPGTKRPMTADEYAFAVKAVNNFAGVVNTAVDRQMYFRHTYYGPNGMVIDAQSVNGQVFADVKLQSPGGEKDLWQLAAHMLYASEDYPEGVGGFFEKSTSRLDASELAKKSGNIKLEHYDRVVVDPSGTKKMMPGNRDWYSTTVPKLKGVVLSWWMQSAHRYGMVANPARTSDNDTYSAYGTARKTAVPWHLLYLNGEPLLEAPSGMRIVTAALHIDEEGALYARVICGYYDNTFGDQGFGYVTYYNVPISWERLYKQGKPIKLQLHSPVWSVYRKSMAWEWGHINSSGTKMILIKGIKDFSGQPSTGSVYELDLNASGPIFTELDLHKADSFISDDATAMKNWQHEHQQVRSPPYYDITYAYRTAQQDYSYVSTYVRDEQLIQVVAVDYRGDEPQVVVVENHNIYRYTVDWGESASYFYEYIKEVGNVSEVLDYTASLHKLESRTYETTARVLLNGEEVLLIDWGAMTYATSFSAQASYSYAHGSGVHETYDGDGSFSGVDGATWSFNPLQLFGDLRVGAWFLLGAEYSTWLAGEPRDFFLRYESVRIVGVPDKYEASLDDAPYTETVRRSIKLISFMRNGGSNDVHVREEFHSEYERQDYETWPPYYLRTTHSYFIMGMGVWDQAFRTTTLSGDPLPYPVIMYFGNFDVFHTYSSRNNYQTIETRSPYAYPYPVEFFIPHCATSTHDGRYFFYSYLKTTDEPDLFSPRNWAPRSNYTGVSKIVKLPDDNDTSRREIDLLPLAPDALTGNAKIVSGLVFAGPIKDPKGKDIKRRTEWPKP